MRLFAPSLLPSASPAGRASARTASHPAGRRQRAVAWWLPRLWVLCTPLFLLVTMQSPAGAADGVGTRIVDVPVTTAYNARPVRFTASTTCEQECPLTLHFRITGGGVRPAGAWQAVAMSPTSVQTPPDAASSRKVFSWEAVVSGDWVDTTGLDYFLQSTGPDGTVSSPRTGQYHVTTLAPPVPQHTPPTFAYDNKDVDLTLQATCSTGRCSADLWYRTSPSGDLANTPLTGLPDWPHAAMSLSASAPLGDVGQLMTFTGRIPASYVDSRGVDYFMIGHRGPARWTAGARYGYEGEADRSRGTLPGPHRRR